MLPIVEGVYLAMSEAPDEDHSEGITHPRWMQRGKSSQRPADSRLSARWSDGDLAGVVGFVRVEGPANDLSGIRKLKEEEEENKRKQQRKRKFWSGRPRFGGQAGGRNLLQHLEEEDTNKPLKHIAG